MENDSEDHESSSGSDVEEEPRYEIEWENELLNELCDVPASDGESEDSDSIVFEEISSPDVVESPPDVVVSPPDVVVSPPDVVVSPPDVVVSPPDVVVSPVCGTTEALPSKFGHHSDAVRCNKIAKSLQNKKLKKVELVNDILLTNIQYHDINDMLPVDGKFLVDADSLLIFALSEEEWGSCQYGQMLHVIYICERILRVFTRIGGICELIFFQCWENVWADKFVTLARTALMAHFKYNTNYVVHVLPNAWDESFKSVLESSKPNFLLQYLDFSKSDFIPKCCARLAKIIGQVNMNFILDSGVDCVDMLVINLSISTINAFVVKAKKIPNQLKIDSAKLLNKILLESAENLSDEVEIPVSVEDVRRDAFISAAAAIIMRKTASQNFVRVFLLKCALFEVLPLKLRACPKVKVMSDEARDFVYLILHYLNLALKKILECNAESPLVSVLCVRVADMWQENFFYKLLALRNFVLGGPSNLGNKTAAAYLSLVQRVNSLGNVNLDPFPITVPDVVQQPLTEVRKRVRKSEHRLELEYLIPSTSQLMKEFCGDSVLQNCWNTQQYSKVYPSICRNRKFKEEYHWHSKKKLVDNTKRVPDSTLTKYELKRKQREQSRYAFFMQYYGNNLEGNRIVSETIVRDLQRGQRPPKAQKENKMSQKALAIINEQVQKRKDETVKQESEKLKLLEALQKEDVSSNIRDVKNFLTRVTSDEVKHKAQMLAANLYYKLLKENYRLNEQGRLVNDFIDFFLLLREMILNCKKRIENCWSKRAVDLPKPKVKQSMKATKQREPIPNHKSEEDEGKMFKELMAICKYFNCLNFGEIAAKCKEEIRSIGLLTDEVLEILEGPVTCADVFDTGFPWAQFQLNYLGPHLERGSLGVFDKELGFAPDDWQAKLITVIRKRQSAIVVAPTSSGKTYASYYCMKSVLKESLDGVVVYVSPTKALVNQVAATVYARFKNTTMADGMCLLGVFTRDYRHNNENCQILVTVPECLEILLLSPKRTKWVKKLRYIIFDEIHCLSGIAGGISWESGLLLSKCPFLALSATIEKPEILERWLKGAAEYKKERDVVDGLYDRHNNRIYEVELIIYTERHNDLEKHLFAQGDLSHVHPYAFLTHKIILQHRSVPKTLSLSPKETLQLYCAMKMVLEDEIAHLIPEVFFSSLSPDGFITKQHVRSFESALNDKFYDLAQRDPSLFQLVLNCLSAENRNETRGTVCSEELIDLVGNLKNNNMLPAIIFSYSRDLVEGMFASLTDHFTKECVSSEDEDEPKKRESEQKTMRKKKEVVRFERREIRCVKLLSSKRSIQGLGVADSDDVTYIARRLGKAGFQSHSPFVCGLRRGIGMHHGGLNVHQRTAVEMLFRMKLLNVLFATGTLALGIHMPCKTVVLAGESRFLNVLNYHQTSGRAGRRGFDTEGNLVFWNVSHKKISHLMTSKLPVMWGNIPMTVSVILRLLLLVSQGFDEVRQTEEDRKWNVSRALAFLNCNLVYQHFPELKQQMKHYFAFSNQLLMCQQLLDDDGNPQALAGIVTHLHYHEPGNLVFVYLLRHGIFNKICKKENGKITKQTELDLVLVLAHLFTNTPLHGRHLQQEFKNSTVILEEMPGFVVKEIEKYNEEVLLVFDNYFKCVAEDCQEQFGEDHTLPLSAAVFSPQSQQSSTGSDQQSTFEKELFSNLEKRLICSSFAALSGHRDVGLYSNKSLFSTIRHQVFTDMKILPEFPINRQLNAYAWDFYNHGLRKAIITDNNLKVGSDFALLKDFSFVLKALYTSLSEFVEPGEANETVVEVFKKVSDNFTDLYNKAYNIRNF